MKLLISGYLIIFLLVFTVSLAAQGESPNAKLIDIAKIVELEKETVHGIDVSHHQGLIDWAKVHEAGLKFTYVKATEGIDYQDPKLIEHWFAAKTAGLKVGPYHMFRPNDGAEEQVKNFITALKKLNYDKNDLPPVLDIERVNVKEKVTHQQLHDRAINFLKMVEREIGRKPIVYTNPSYWKHFLKDIHQLQEFPLWIAEYNHLAKKPKTTGAWKTWKIWQFSEWGKLDGIEKPVDINRFNGSHAEFLKLDTSEKK